MAHTSPGALSRELRTHHVTLKLNLMRASVARLCGRVKTLLQDLVQQHRRRGAHVERFDAPAQRERHEVVARRGDPRPQPLPLCSEHEDDAFSRTNE